MRSWSIIEQIFWLLCSTVYTVLGMVRTYTCHIGHNLWPPVTAHQLPFFPNTPWESFLLFCYIRSPARDGSSTGQVHYYRHIKTFCACVCGVCACACGVYVCVCGVYVCVCVCMWSDRLNAVVWGNWQNYTPEAKFSFPPEFNWTTFTISFWLLLWSRCSLVLRPDHQMLYAILRQSWI